MLKSFQKQAILKSFPTNLELCHGSVIHHKVHSADYYRIIPKGKKYFMFFQKYGSQINTYFLETSSKQFQIIDILSYDVCLKHTLTVGKYGTICYGTMFMSNRIRCFTIEDVMYYKSNKVCQHPWGKKFSIIHDIMNHIQQVQYTKQGIVVGIPILMERRTTLQQLIMTLPYQVYCIEHISCSKRNILIEHIRAQLFTTKGIFMIQATLTSDIYRVLCEKKDIGMAYIPNYKASVLMNKEFRYIKENSNLDLLEESDDDEEFEQIDLDKFVNLDKIVPFKCTYHKKFRMWMPVQKAKMNCKCTSYRSIQYACEGKK